MTSLTQVLTLCIRLKAFKSTSIDVDDWAPAAASVAPSSAGQAPGAGQSVCSSCPEMTPVGSFAANSGAEASAVQMPSRPCVAPGLCQLWLLGFTVESISRSSPRMFC